MTIPRHRPLYDIAREIKNDWKKPYFGAVPYIDAMKDLDQITDMYIHDTGLSVVLYFLSNCATWRGPRAREIKNELKRIVRSTGYKL